MNAFNDISIKNKLIGIILIVTVVVVVGGFTADIFITNAVLRDELSDSTALHAKLIGEYCVVPLSFDDQSEATNILAKLSTLPSLESGYVYAPYVPLQVTPTIFGTEDFVPRKGVMTRYAKKMVRPDMYGLVIVRGLLGESGGDGS